MKLVRSSNKGWTTNGSCKGRSKKRLDRREKSKRERNEKRCWKSRGYKRNRNNSRDKLMMRITQRRLIWSKSRRII